MTRKNYVAIAAALALSRPNTEQFTSHSAIDDNTMFNGIAFGAAYGAWAVARDSISYALIGTNPLFDRERFIAATEA